ADSVCRSSLDFLQPGYRLVLPVKNPVGFVATAKRRLELRKRGVRTRRPHIEIGRADVVGPANACVSQGGSGTQSGVATVRCAHQAQHRAAVSHEQFSADDPAFELSYKKARKRSSCGELGRQFQWVNEVPTLLERQCPVYLLIGGEVFD